MALKSVDFGRPFLKRFAICCPTVVCLSVCLSCLSDCDVGVLWPNGWMDQDETWRVGRPRPWPRRVRWRPNFPSPNRPQFSAGVYCGQTARWIKMPLGVEVGLSLGDIVLDEDPAPLPVKGHSPTPIFSQCPLWPNGWRD